MNVWQPIKTAPKDGTEVMVYAPTKHGLPDIECLCSYHPDAGWCVCEFRDVTHWKPIAITSTGEDEV